MRTPPSPSRAEPRNASGRGRGSCYAIMLPRVLRPEIIMRIDRDTLYCAAVRAHESPKAWLAVLRRNIGHLFQARAAFLAGRIRQRHHFLPLELGPSSDSTPRSAEWFPPSGNTLRTGGKPLRWSPRALLRCVVTTPGTPFAPAGRGVYKGGIGQPCGFFGGSLRRSHVSGFGGVRFAPKADK
jgi:hypothetical protein